jgi:TetR/AcrR family transcriptional repressor of mexJK operon
MTTTAHEKTVREGQPAKRAAILAAARDLFLRDGFERTSMDAVAAQANVSKRTVYDYYGDKERLQVEVIDDAGESLLTSLKAALVDHLSDDEPIRTADDLERALLAFSLEIGTTIIGSTDYATVFTLSGKPRRDQPELMSRHLSTAPEDAVAERLAHFDEVGILDAPDPRTAADHFNALTLLLAYNNQPDPADADPAEVRRTMTAGVHAFMRAYAARS